MSRARSVTVRTTARCASPRGELAVPVWRTSTRHPSRASSKRRRPDCTVVSSVQPHPAAEPAAAVPLRQRPLRPAAAPTAGRANVNWAIINGQAEAAISIHVIERSGTTATSSSRRLSRSARRHGLGRVPATQRGAAPRARPYRGALPRGLCRASSGRRREQPRLHPGRGGRRDQLVGLHDGCVSPWSVPWHRPTRGRSPTSARAWLAIVRAAPSPSGGASSVVSPGGWWSARPRPATSTSSLATGPCGSTR